VTGSTKLIVITDIGYDPDDMFALAYLIKRGVIPDLIVTSDEVFPFRRACLAHFCTDVWQVRVPIVTGIDLGSRNFISDTLLPNQWNGGSAFNLEMTRIIESSESTTIIGLGGFTEFALVATRHPHLLRRCHLIQMGGALDYSHRDGWIEHNIRIDPAAAERVLSYGVNRGLKVTLVGAQTTFDQRLQVAAGSRIYYGARTSSNYALKLLALHADLFAQEKKHWPMMHDPLTCSVALGETFVEFEETAIAIDEQGHMQRGGIGMPTIRVSRPNCDALGFMKHLEGVLLR
jgi:inosine-uridine nucleoside N-ribohydrolase